MPYAFNRSEQLVRENHIVVKHNLCNSDNGMELDAIRLAAAQAHTIIDNID